MKLCRFDLVTEPGAVRSGIVYGGKVYETDGENASAVHEASDVRLLTPIGLAPSVRLFDPTTVESDWMGLSEGHQSKNEYNFAYLNPSAIVGPQTELMPCHFSEDLTMKPCLACIVSAPGTQIPHDEADPYMLGLTLVNVFLAADAARIERVRGYPPSRSHDVGIALGPAITTPDELDETLVQDLQGKRYKMTIFVQVNGEEVARFDTGELPFTLAEVIAYSSESSAIRAGDVICISLGEVVLNQPLRTGDEVRLVSDRLGTLVNRVG